MDFNYIIEYIKTKEFNYLLIEFYKSIIIYYIVFIFGKLFCYILKIIYKFIKFFYNLISKIMNYNTKLDNLNINWYYINSIFCNQEKFELFKYILNIYLNILQSNSIDKLNYLNINGF